MHYDTKLLTPEQICEAIEDMGFDASLPQSHKHKEDVINTCSIHIEGMTCNSCVNTIEGMF